MDPHTALLLVMIGIAVVALIATVLFWIGHRRGRGVQAAAVAALSLGLYFSGLAELCAQAVKTLVTWASGLTLTPMVWAGFALLALTVLLWIIGGIIARRSVTRRALERSQGTAPAGRTTTADKGAGATSVTTGSATSTPSAQGAGKQTPGKKKPAQPAASTGGDPEMDEIEALLRKRGIE